MAILHVASSVADVTGTSGSVTTNAAHLATGAQEGIYCDDLESAVIDLDTGQSLLFAGFTQVYDAGTNINNVDTSSSGVTSYIWRAFNTAYSFTTPLFQLKRYKSGALDFLRLEYWDGVAFQAVGSDYNQASPLNLKTYRYDLKIDMNATDGVILNYLDGVQTHAFSGNTIQTSATTIDRFSVHNPINNNGDCAFSNIILATEDTQNLELAGLYPTGIGALSEWTGNYQDVDEFGLGADFISTNVSGKTEQHTVDPIPSSFASQQVRAVVHAIRARNGSSGPQNIRSNVRVAGIDSFSTNLNVGGTMKAIQKVWDTNPVTTTTWAQADVNNAQFGVKSIT